MRYVALAIGLALLFGFAVGRKWARLVPLGIGVALAALQLYGELSEPNGETHWIYWPMAILTVAVALSVLVALGVAVREGVARPRQAPELSKREGA